MAKKPASKPPTPPTSELTVHRFVTWDPEHQRQFLKFFGNTTPDEFRRMPPARQRALLQSANASSRVARQPDSVLAPQSLTNVYKGAESAANLKYTPVQHEIEGDQRASNVQQGRITDWFAYYQKQLKDIDDC